MTKRIFANAVSIIALGLLVGACNKSKGTDQPQGGPGQEQQVPQPGPQPDPNDPGGPNPRPDRNFPPTGRVCFFRFQNFQGPSFCLVPGQHKSYLSVQGPHALVGSILVQGDASAMLFERSGFGGRSVLIQRALPDVARVTWHWRGLGASVKILRRGGRPPAAPRPDRGPRGPQDDPDEDRDQDPDDNRNRPGPQQPGPGNDDRGPAGPDDQGPFPDEDPGQQPDDRNGPFPDDQDNGNQPRDNGGNANNGQPRGNASGKVCFFSDEGFKGHSFCLNAGTEERDLPNLGWGNVISSIKIEGDVGVQIYRAENLTGASKVVTKSTSDLGSLGAEWNNSIASVRIISR